MNPNNPCAIVVKDGKILGCGENEKAACDEVNKKLHLPFKTFGCKKNIMSVPSGKTYIANCPEELLKEYKKHGSAISYIVNDDGILDVNT